MTQRYRVTGARPVLDTDPGDEFEHEFTAAEEHDLLNAARVAIVPRRYQVIGSSRVQGTEQGGYFMAAYTVDQERALLDGGHIERHEPRAAAPKAKTSDKDAPPPATDKSKE